MAPVMEDQPGVGDLSRIQGDHATDRCRLGPQQRLTKYLDDMRRPEDPRGRIAQTFALRQSAQTRMLIEPAGITVLPVQAGADRAWCRTGTDESSDLHCLLAEDDLAVIDLAIAEPHGGIQIRNQM